MIHPPTEMHKAQDMKETIEESVALLDRTVLQVCPVLFALLFVSVPCSFMTCSFDNK